ncbi:uncharacterized protein CEXT_152471 [Caerostris extrusa]|uniref:Uncharacterized protein n=1 Tax=Caerostris extrusa TaxID=172846 RepID=A0AAV4WPT3_CAEEX|nr:uncharacterized protein CEXT_152471 [Caerostris extrusa]
MQTYSENAAGLVHVSPGFVAPPGRDVRPHEGARVHGGGGQGRRKKMKDEAEKIKEEADDENMTEEQFFRCFADINCNLGIEAKDELFKCWHLNTAEELDQYSVLFKGSPVGNFQRLNIDDVNADFCVLEEGDQEVCADRSKKEQCMRIKSTAECVSELLERYVATGKCETIVKEINPMAE